jgi:hypothetical protein
MEGVHMALTTLEWMRASRHVPRRYPAEVSDQLFVGRLVSLLGFVNSKSRTQNAAYKQ